MAGESSTRFQIHSKNFFLTYPHCPLNAEYVADFLFHKYNDTAYVTVGIEQHQDGEPHVHALLQTAGRHNIYDRRFFDIIFTFEDVSCTYHPNIQSSRNPFATRKYIQKGGNFIEQGSLSHRGKQYGDCTKHEDYKAILQEATSQEHFLQLCRERVPRDYALFLERLEYVARKTWPEQPQPYISRFTDFLVPHNLVEWARENLLTVRTDWMLQQFPNSIHEFFNEDTLAMEVIENMILVDNNPETRRIQVDDPGASSSRDPQEQERLNGQDPSDLITITPDIWTSANIELT